jgi:hypothetical protein
MSKSDAKLVRLRRDFVSMLFALATAEIAIIAFAVFMARVPERSAGFPSEAWCRTAAISHLTLALFVIATSWIGWSRSKSADRGVNGVFDPNFPAWIVDVILVVLYFCLTCSVEVKGSIDSHDFSFTPPSARPETMWTLWLLVMYGVWDALTKWCEPGQVGAIGRVRHWFACAFASLTSIALAIGIWALVKWVVQPRDADHCEAFDAVLVDGALIALVVLFRVMKSAEIAWFQKWKIRAEGLQPPPESCWPWKAAALIAVIVTASGICYYRPKCPASGGFQTTVSPAPAGHRPQRPIVYIASPYSKGDPAINTHFQCETWNRLIDDGKVWPVAPLWSHFQDVAFPRDYHNWVDYDLALIPRYDACLRVNPEYPQLGYAESRSSGADNEVTEFRRLGKPVFYSISDLYAWVDGASGNVDPRPRH